LPGWPSSRGCAGGFGAVAIDLDMHRDEAGAFTALRRGSATTRGSFKASFLNCWQGAQRSAVVKAMSVRPSRRAASAAAPSVARIAQDCGKGRHLIGDDESGCGIEVMSNGEAIHERPLRGGRRADGRVARRRPRCPRSRRRGLLGSRAAEGTSKHECGNDGGGEARATHAASVARFKEKAPTVRSGLVWPCLGDGFVARATGSASEPDLVGTHRAVVVHAATGRSGATFARLAGRSAGRVALGLVRTSAA
jgi:hypothetical protein